MGLGSEATATIHEIKVLYFHETHTYENQVQRIRQLVGLMSGIVGFIDVEAFYSESSNRWVLHLVWKEADEPYVVSATTADASAIMARLTQSARLVRVVP